MAAIIVALVGGFLYHLRNEHHRWYRVYRDQVVQGMTKQDVMNLFGEPTEINVCPVADWDFAPLGEEANASITSSIQYDRTPPVFALSHIYFQFSFDSNDVIVGKHLYD